MTVPPISKPLREVKKRVSGDTGALICTEIKSTCKETEAGSFLLLSLVVFASMFFFCF